MSVLILKHLRCETSSSVEIQLDRRTKSLSGVFSENITNRCSYKPAKNLYYIQDDYSQYLIMDMLLDLRKNRWDLLTSNAFMHNSGTRNIVETTFYYERDIEIITNSSTSIEKFSPEKQTAKSDNYLSPSVYLSPKTETKNPAIRRASNRYIGVDLDREGHVTPQQVNPLQNSTKTVSQSAPYSFATRQSVLSGLYKTRNTDDGSNKKAVSISPKYIQQSNKKKVAAIDKSEGASPSSVRSQLSRQLSDYEEQSQQTPGNPKSPLIIATTSLDNNQKNVNPENENTSSSVNESSQSWRSALYAANASSIPTRLLERQQNKSFELYRKVLSGSAKNIDINSASPIAPSQSLPSTSLKNSNTESSFSIMKHAKERKHYKYHQQRR